MRADAQRNIDTLLQTAMAVFATSGVDAPVREIAEKAGVGVGTVYRHFPQRSDLIAAVFRREIDACADAAPVLAAEHEPGEALARWMQRYVDFIAAKRGLATALHSGDPAYDTLPAYFKKRLEPALRTLLNVGGSCRRGPHRCRRRRIFWVRSQACACTHTNRGPNKPGVWLRCSSMGYATARAHRSNTDGLDVALRGNASAFP